MKLQKYRPLTLLLFFIISLSFLLLSCDKYQSESYEISAVDGMACAQIQDTTAYDSINAVKLTNFDSTWTHENVRQNVPAIIDSLKANGIIVTEGDLSTWVTTVPDEDTNYVCFTTKLSSEIFYSDQVIVLRLMDIQGEISNPADISMPQETIGGCMDEESSPIIKTRLEFASPDEDYLLYIINQEQTTSTTIILSILNGN